MRSQEIKIRNIPTQRMKPHQVRVKPVWVLITMIVIGALVIITNRGMASVGMVIVLLGLFALILMPDRVLAQFSEEYLILFDSRNREACSLIYWEDVVSWQYEYGFPTDTLIINLVDGTSRTCDMYGKYSVSGRLNQYATGKEVKSSRKKES